MKTRLLNFLIALISISAIAQDDDLFYKSYDWNDDIYQTFDVSLYQDKDIVLVDDKRVTEFAFSDTEYFVEYQLIHKTYWLNSNDKIEEFNKVYLPISKSRKLEKSKARVINSEGKVFELSESKILEAKDNSSGSSYKYFALEGIDKGSFIDYFYVIKKYPDYQGRRLFFQDEYFRKHSAFDLIAPSNLEFTSKSYNGLPEMKLDTLVTNKNHWKLRVGETDGLEEEEKAAYNTKLQQLIYKLDRNSLNPSKEIVSYGNISQEIFKIYNPELDKKTIKKVNGFTKKEEIDHIDDETLIRNLENYIKSNVYYNESENNMYPLETVIDNKIATSNSLMLLYATVFNLHNIDFEIVLTIARDQCEFDEDFESYNFLDEYLIYFPDLDLYMEPLNYGNRLGFPNGYLTDTKGLFIKKVKIGDFVSGIGKVKYIEPVNYDKSAYNMKMDVEFDPNNINNLRMNMSKEMHGYYAISLQPYLGLIKPEEKDQMAEAYIKSLNENITILDQSFENDTMDDFAKKPLRLNAKIESEYFVENAGNKLLFKVGELIGPQSEMYQEKARKLDVCDDYERKFKHMLTIKIPEGYTLNNLEDINIHEEYLEDGEEIFKFHSQYRLEGDVLKIRVDEFYNKTTIPVAIYEDYRRVINSAANFNKITLVMIPN